MRSVDFAGAIHLHDKRAEAFRLGFGGFHDGKPLLDLFAALVEELSNYIGGANLRETFPEVPAFRSVAPRRLVLA